MTLLTGVCEERSLAAIINLHDVPLARRFCPRIVGISGGRIVSDGPASSLDDDVLRHIYGEEEVATGGAEPG
jgi:phosphonate transport system ATP-binding protein